MQKTSYELSDEDLLDKLMDATAAAGTASSGLILDITVASRVVTMLYLKGCVPARLKGLKPEMQPGARVSAPSGESIRGVDLEGRSFDVIPIQHQTSEVARVWYFKDAWRLELKGVRTKEGATALYPADKFFVEKEACAAAA